MDIFEVTLPLIEKKATTLYRVLIAIGVVSIVVMFWAVLHINIPRYVVFISLALAALCFNAHYVVKVYDVVGDILLRADVMIVTTAAGICEYRIAEMQEFKVVLLGVKGEFVGVKTIAAKTGADNAFSFKYNGELFNFFFLLESDKVDTLSAMLQVWKIYNVPFHLDNLTNEPFK